MARAALRWAAANSARRAAIRLTALVLCIVVAGCMPGGPARQVSVWIVSGDDDLSADSPPNPENDIYSASRGEVRVDAALNETLAFQVVLRTTAPLAGPFEVRVSDLRGPSGRLTAADVVTRYRVQYARVESFRSWYPPHTGRPAIPTLFPDILVPWDAPRGGGPLLLSEARNEIVWLDVHIPLTAQPGEYVGQVEAAPLGAGAPVFTCRLRVSVLPVALPDRRSLPVVCRVDPTDLLVTHLRWPRQPPELTRLLPSSPGHLAAIRLVSETMRLFQAHRTTPVLWASFPKLRPVGEQAVEVQWDEYDQLVAGWLDGAAFADGVRLEFWPLPLAVTYPAAELYGGLDSPRYARVLRTYLNECRRHFAERGWLDRAALRPLPPEPLTTAAVERCRRMVGVLRQGEAPTPILAHLPARSLRGLGWHDAPSSDLSDVSIWAPPAMWFEPDAMARERKLGRQAWLMPAYPPYSGSPAVEAPAADSRALPWLAYRYEVAGVWIEDAARLDAPAASDTAGRPWLSAGLIHAGEPYGLRDRPVPSVRLKRLALGLQDVELLRLLEVNGRPQLARELAGEMVRWGGTDAALGNLLHDKPAGWPRSTAVFRLAHALMLHELAAEFVPAPAARQRQIDSLARWGVLLGQRDRLAVTLEGIRLTPEAAGLRAHLFGRVENVGSKPVRGRWELPAPPPDWQLVTSTALLVEPGARRPVHLELSLPGLAYNIDGVYPFELALETEGGTSQRLAARLAVAVCLRVDDPLRIDGRLDDWPLAADNTAGDFRLNRLAPGAAAAEAPARATRAFFALDQEHIYVGVRCTLRAGESPVCRADNDVPVDGAAPWGQDVVEVLIDPRGEPVGSARDIYALQIKPTGLVIAHHGCRTEPPVGPSIPWPCGARVAVAVEREAWVVELAVPLAAFPAEARRQRIWGVNVTRLDAARGEYSSWSGARGTCYLPATLGNLIMLWP